jgi:hypothetical protein
MKSHYLALVCLVANFESADAANSVVTGEIKETEWFGTKHDSLTSVATTYDFVFDDDTGFVNEITMCSDSGGLDDREKTIAVQFTAKAPCSGPDNINSQFGKEPSLYDTEVYTSVHTDWCNVGKTGKSNACIRKI